ncbi:hypothetical protein H310_05462, partial [Aphanomyces invadans]
IIQNAMSVAYYPTPHFSMVEPFQANGFASLNVQRPTQPPPRLHTNASPSVHKKPVEAKRQWRGTCRYKSGRCSNERTLKFNGEIHTMCEEHRIRHNNNQRRSDLKRRIKKAPEITSLSYQGSMMHLMHSPSGTASSCNSLLRPALQKQLFEAFDLASKGHDDSMMLSPEAMEAINMLDADDDSPVQLASCTMELTPHEVHILHSILGMDDECMG